MSELIRREDAVNYCLESAEGVKSTPSWESLFLEMAEHFKHDIPTVAAVDVVRCRDCKHWVKTDSGTTCRKNILDFAPKHEDFFCAAGERREQP